MPAGHKLIQQRPFLTMESGEAQGAEVLAVRESVLQPSELQACALTYFGVISAFHTLVIGTIDADSAVTFLCTRTCCSFVV